MQLTGTRSTADRAERRPRHDGTGPATRRLFAARGLVQAADHRAGVLRMNQATHVPMPSELRRCGAQTEITNGLRAQLCTSSAWRIHPAGSPVGGPAGRLGDLPVGMMLADQREHVGDIVRQRR